MASSPIKMPCQACGGTGVVGVCTKCQGRGKTAGFFGLGRRECSQCWGRGFFERGSIAPPWAPKAPCPVCGGQG